MKIRIWALMTVGVMMLSGCYWRTLFPLFTSTDLVTNDALLGYWMAPDSAGGWIFEKGEENLYTVTLVSKDKSTKAVGRLGRIKNYLFIDLQPPQSFISDDNYDTYALPIHSFSRLQLNDRSLSMITINFEWLKTLLKKKPSELKHEWVNESLLITASTKDLKKFTARYADNSEAFSDTSTFTRTERR
jgi:hypothetical protein